MIKAIIVDDEPLAQEVLQAHLDKIPDITLVASCQNAIEARQILKEHDIDLMYLDIQMPEINGVEFAKSLTHPPSIIFTTAYDNYAVEGFELNAVDYLLKPISLDRFIKATDKAITKIQGKQQSGSDSDPEDDFFFVKSDKKMIKVSHADILYIEGLKDYVQLKMSDRRVIALQTMKSLEDKLPSTTFLRVHRSYIVNVDKIEAVTGHMIELTERGKTTQIPVGKSYRDGLLEIIERKKL